MIIIAAPILIYIHTPPTSNYTLFIVYRSVSKYRLKAPKHGFEPQFQRSERRVLPLDDSGMQTLRPV
jgi:hypothetical protein